MSWPADDSARIFTIFFYTKQFFILTDDNNFP